MKQDHLDKWYSSLCSVHTPPKAYKLFFYSWLTRVGKDLMNITACPDWFFVLQQWVGASRKGSVHIFCCYWFITSAALTAKAAAVLPIHVCFTKPSKPTWEFGMFIKVKNQWFNRSHWLALVLHYSKRTSQTLLTPRIVKDFWSDCKKSFKFSRPKQFVSIWFSGKYSIIKYTFKKYYWK